MLQVYTFTGTPLAAGQYKEVNVVYSGGTANGVTFNPTSSGGQGLPDVTTQVLPVGASTTLSLWGHECRFQDFAWQHMESCRPSV